MMVALDADTGQQRWEYDGDGPGYGSPIIATFAGKRQIVTPVDYLAEYPVDPSGRAWAHPALVGKRILVKGDEDLTCWSLP